jgi:hypothetical protein
VSPLKNKLPELYIATDVEADGPIPGPYSMLSFGMAVVGRPELTFYTELKPISSNYIPQALKVSGFNREELMENAPEAKVAMENAANWINNLRNIGRPVFLAGPAVWDGMFIHWYFFNFLGKSPFGQTGSGIDLRSYWMGIEKCEWIETRKGKIKYALGLKDIKHTHNALEDAKELAVVFDEILKTQRKSV